MCKLSRLFVLLVLVYAPMVSRADTGESTRIVDPKQHAPAGGGRNQYRGKSEYVLKELDLKPGDVVVDIGAGDGWWSRQMAEFVGTEGVIHAGEIEQKKVDDMKVKCADTPQFKPYLIPLDGTALPEDSCDLAFLSKTYHHFNEGAHVDYLRHLHKVVKPTGRLCVIERYSAIPGRRSGERARLVARLADTTGRGGGLDRRTLRADHGDLSFHGDIRAKGPVPARAGTRRTPSRRRRELSRPTTATWNMIVGVPD